MKKLFIAVITIVIAVSAGLALWYSQVAAPAAQKSSAKQAAAQAAQQKVSFDKSAYSTTDPTSPWVIVNKQHALSPIDYTPSDLVNIGNGQFMRAEAATALQKMLADAKTAGYTVTAASGYRSYKTQVSVYNNEVATNGKAVADSESARPGYSEHQTGWAIDFASGGCSITDCFGQTPGGQWIVAHAYQYGFILRYTQANTNITGYRAEAWHFRYVGTTLSNELQQEHITTLEEFFGISGGSTYK